MDAQGAGSIQKRSANTPQIQKVEVTHAAESTNMNTESGCHKPNQEGMTTYSKMRISPLGLHCVIHPSINPEKNCE